MPQPHRTSVIEVKDYSRLHEALKKLDELKEPEAFRGTTFDGRTPFVKRISKNLFSIVDLNHDSLNPWAGNNGPLNGLLRGEYISRKRRGMSPTKERDLQAVLEPNKPKKEDFMYLFKTASVTPARRYPMAWLMYPEEPINQSQLHQTLVNRSFFKDHYVDKDWEQTACTKALPHQQFVEYCCRPFSPVRRLLVHARTGSGKTRMMTAILDNFAGYPNRKILLFPTRALRTQFYKELEKSSTTFFAPARTVTDPPITHRVRPQYEHTPDGNYEERPDAFNTYYSREDEGDVIHPVAEVAFETYVKQHMDEQRHGATLFLTFNQFDLMLQDSDTRTLRLTTHFVNPLENKLTLGEATVLVDEAHLLHQPKWRRIRTFLGSEPLHSLYLFSATPYMHVAGITDYRSLLWATSGETPTESTLKRNCVARYEVMHDVLYNRENYTMVEVPASSWLATRDTDSDGLFEPYKTKIAFTSYSVTDPGYRNAFPQFLSGKPCDDIRNCTHRDIDTVYANVCGDGIHPDMVGNYFVPELIHHLFPIGARVLQDVLMRLRERRTLLEWLADPQKDYTDPCLPSHVKDTHSLDLLQTSVDEWRFVIMVDWTNGLCEMSKLLQKYDVPHVIHGNDKREHVLSQARMKQTYHLDGAAERALQQCTMKPFSDREKYYIDSDLLTVFNTTTTIPVLLTNVSSPEGFSVYRTSNLFVMTGDTLTGSGLTQACGRINRMCHKTVAHKDIRVYTISKQPSCDEVVQKKKKIDPAGTYLDSGLYDDDSQKSRKCVTKTIRRDLRSSRELPDGPYDTSIPSRVRHGP